MKSILYPHSWPEIAHEIKAANRYICQSCNRQCRRPGEMWIGWEYELTVAHWDREYDADAIFVVPLCRKCHFLHDAPFVWSARRRWRRLRQWQAGQLEMFTRPST